MGATYEFWRFSLHFLEYNALIYAFSLLQFPAFFNAIVKYKPLEYVFGKLRREKSKCKMLSLFKVTNRPDLAKRGLDFLIR